MMRKSFLNAVAEGQILVCDGAAGTELQRRGLPFGLCGDIWNLDNPTAVAEVHRSYVAARADILLTNTFSTNRYRLAHFGLSNKVRDIATAAVEIARRSACPQNYILGDIGPLGEFLEPIGEITRAQAVSAFQEVAQVFADLGVDGMIIETLSATEEMECAVEAVRNVAPTTPLVACFTFEKTAAGLRTMTGATPEDCARLLTGLPVDVVGTNCGANLDEDSYVEIVRCFAQISKRPVLVEPNAGTPVLEDGKIVYKATPEELASWISPLLAAGAKVIGGCCGTTPAHIRAIRQTLQTVL
ncbi:MAG: homocysteine S-methyltransferase family protein [Candidatus Sumerlaeaceae bacterium]